MGEAMGMLFIGVFYFYPSLHLFRFASHIRELSETHRLADLEAAVREQKSFWKFCGVTVSIMLAFYVLLMLGDFCWGADGQGQRTLSCLRRKDFDEEVVVPSAAAALHSDAILARMLFQKG